jgi:DnaJ-class molecular chaperone
MYYKILELDENSSKDDIKKAYKNLARKWHPDKHVNKSKAELEDINIKFNKITTAYNKLLNQNQNQNQYANTKKEYDDIDNIYYNRLNINQSQNITIEKSITIKDIYNNIFSQIYYQYKKRCIKCIGKGYLNISNPDNCLECDGTGLFKNKKCNLCRGIGKYIEDKYICSICLGNKYLINNNLIYYNFNNNIIKDDRDTKLKFSMNQNNVYNIIAKGNESDYGTGNLILNINITHDRYKIIDNNLYITKNILLSEALIGFCHEIVLPDNTKIIIQNNNSIIKPNQNLVINNFGILKNNNKGSLVVKFNIEFPKKLSSNDRKIIKSLFPNNDHQFNLKNNIVISI